MNSTTQKIAAGHLTGADLKAALSAATAVLQRYSGQINALNVFPVPDGDTGTNMLLTMRAVQEKLDDIDDNSVSIVAQEAARGALYGARGNSGVILSQFLAGFAEGLKGLDVCDGNDLTQALSAASEASYSAVSKPVEGTMLTVIRGFYEGARDAADNNSDRQDALALWHSGLENSRAALADTPNLLPVLRDAGVIDSGGQGIVVIMEGALCHLRGDDHNALEIEMSTPEYREGAATEISQDYLDATQDEEYGYCTEFIIQGEGLDVGGLRSYLADKGSSLIVVGDSTVVKVHIHTFEPDAVIAHGGALGETSGVKVDDISQQHEGFVAMHTQEREAPELSVVTVAWGDGFIDLFNNAGAHAIIPCGRTMNPSAQEIVQAAESVGSKEVAILPNNSNVILTARQAAEIADAKLHVIPTTSQTEGIAAMLSYTADLPTDQTLSAMRAAMEDVVTVEVTTAHRDTVMDGQAVSRGQVIGLVNGRLESVGSVVDEVALEAAVKAGPDEHSVVTIYWGGDAEEEDAAELSRSLQSRLPEVEIEAVYGGQPFFHYIVSIE